MAVYREGYSAIEQLTKNSVQIFEDASDFGCPVKKDDKNWNTAKQLVEWYGEPETRRVERYSTGSSVTCQVELMDEWAVSDGRKTEKQATDRFLVSFVTCTAGKCKGMNGYIEINKI